MGLFQKTPDQIALEFLRKRGMKLLTKNWSNRYGKVNLICNDNGTIVFVGVNSQAGGKYRNPNEVFDKLMLIKIKNAANSYIRTYTRYNAFKRRIDIVGIVLDNKGKASSIGYFENVIV